MFSRNTIVCADCSDTVERTGSHQIVCKNCAKKRRHEKDKRITAMRSAKCAKTIVCADCKQTVDRTGPRMRLCKPCATERKRRRHNEWAKNNVENLRESARERMRLHREINRKKKKEEYEHWLKYVYPEISRIDGIKKIREERRNRKLEKKRREYLRRYVKFLISEYEKYRGTRVALPYTTMRYVSQEEINKMVEMFPNEIRVWSWNSLSQKFGNAYNDVKYPEQVSISVVRDNCFDGRIYETVDSPGYYRVEVNKKPSPFFYTACAEGIPDMSIMGRKSRWKESFDNEWGNRVKLATQEKNLRDYKAKRLEERRAFLLQAPEKRESKQFFQAIAMASAVVR